MSGYSIGVDIGGTKISAAIVDVSGKLYHKKIFSTPRVTKKAVLDLLKETIHSYIEIAEIEGMDIKGVGIGSAGQVDFREGKILSGTKNLADWNEVEITSVLSRNINLPIYLDNDANTFAIAERYIGSGIGLENMVCLTLGTGIGGGVISGSRILRGEWGGAAELGHITVNMEGPLCNCGSRGCLETYASGNGIANRMKEKLFGMHDADDKEIDAKQMYENLTSKDVFRWYNEGDPTAVEIINLAINALTYAIVNIIHTFNPSIVILGGGVAEGRDWMSKMIKARINQIGLKSLVDPTDILTSKLGSDAGLIGAAYQIWKE